jgi:hypothetical protein
MTKDILKELIIGDLGKLKQEMGAYQNEEKIWYIEESIMNSAGNLCLHLVGNLNTYIGAQYGQTDYVRNREAEFSLKNIPRAKLIDKIDQTIAMIGKAFDMMSAGQLDELYPSEILLKGKSTNHFFVYLAMHLSYHLGQINYHRRLLDH